MNSNTQLIFAGSKAIYAVGDLEIARVTTLFQVRAALLAIFLALLFVLGHRHKLSSFECMHGLNHSMFEFQRQLAVAI